MHRLQILQTNRVISLWMMIVLQTKAALSTCHRWSGGRESGLAPLFLQCNRPSVPENYWSMLYRCCNLVRHGCISGSYKCLAHRLHFDHSVDHWSNVASGRVFRCMFHLSKGNACSHAVALTWYQGGQSVMLRSHGCNGMAQWHSLRQWCRSWRLDSISGQRDDRPGPGYLLTSLYHLLCMASRWTTVFHVQNREMWGCVYVMTPPMLVSYYNFTVATLYQICTFFLRSGNS